MAFKIKVTREDFDKIILKHCFGNSVKKIAEEIGVSENTVSRCIWAFAIVKEKDWEKATSYVQHGYGINYIKLACESLETELPIDVTNAYSEWMISKGLKKGKKEEPQEEPKQAEKEEKPQEEPKKPVNDVLYFCKILESLAKTNELLEQLMDVVIPKHVIDQKDNLNANIDLLCQRLQTSDEKLEKIVYNTRKRGT